MGRQKRIDRNCDHCGKVYAARTDTLALGRGRYCGRDCASSSRRSTPQGEGAEKVVIRKTLARNCDHCGVEYQARIDSLEKGMGRYCGRPCHFAVRRMTRVKRTCEGCGVEFEVIPAKLKAVRGGSYCTAECRAKNCHVKVPVEDRFWEKVDRRGPDECWPWKAGTSTAGYGRLTINGKTKAAQASRVSWEIHNGPIPDGRWVLHRCDNPPCCNPAHLFLGDNAINTQDKVNKGRQRRGETAPMAKFSEEAVVGHKRRYGAGEPLPALAREYGMHYQTAYKIVRGTRRANPA